MKRSLISLAHSVARSVHAPQLDDGGHPYLDHIARVVNGVAEFKSVDITVTALLHDVLEKSSRPFRILSFLEKNFPPNIFSAVLALTKLITDSSYEDHLRRIIETGRIPVIVKMAELYDNMQLERLYAVSGQREHSGLVTFDSKILQRHEQYRQAFAKLETVWLAKYAI